MHDGERLSFLERRLSPDFEMRSVTIAPGSRYAFDESEWDDALVVVERGKIELECGDGTRNSFVGAICCA